MTILIGVKSDESAAGSVALCDVHRSCILMCMRTTLILDPQLVARAKALSGIEEKTAVLHEGLRALVARESARRLAALGGSDPRAAAPRRRRPVK
jgi:Arc/MetJ family transcription regulator